MDHDMKFLREAIALAAENVRAQHGGPFGAIIVRGDHVVGRGWNQVTVCNDPTAHAEIVAIREACRRMGHFSLEGSVLYASCEPCPMCLAAAYWARIDRIVFGASRRDAADIGFDDFHFYEELARPLELRTVAMAQHLRPEAVAVMQSWNALPEKRRY